MEIIQILGPGCPRCRTLTENVRVAVKELGLKVRVEKVTDLTTISGMGVFTTPGLAVDGEILSAGRLLSVRQVRALLEEREDPPSSP